MTTPPPPPADVIEEKTESFLYCFLKGVAPGPTHVPPAPTVTV
jgi:hypothetical protein